MTKVKVFHASATMLPMEWAAAVGCTSHHQGTVVVVATSKAVATAVLADRLGQRSAEEIARGLRVASEHWTTGAHLRDAGILRPGEVNAPVVLVWHNPVKDKPIVAVEPDNSTTLVGHFRFESLTPEGQRGRHLYAEKVED